MATEAPQRMYPCGETVPSCVGGCGPWKERRAGGILYRECPGCAYAEISLPGLDTCFHVPPAGDRRAAFTTMRCSCCGFAYCPDHCGPSGRFACCVIQETPGLGDAHAV